MPSTCLCSIPFNLQQEEIKKQGGAWWRERVKAQMKEECWRVVMAFTVNCDGSGSLRSGEEAGIVSEMPAIDLKFHPWQARSDTIEQVEKTNVLGKLPKQKKKRLKKSNWKHYDLTATDTVASYRLPPLQASVGKQKRHVWHSSGSQQEMASQSKHL